MDRKPVHIRMERELVKRIDHLRADYELTRTAVIELIVAAAIDDFSETTMSAILSK